LKRLDTITVSGFAPDQLIDTPELVSFRELEINREPFEDDIHVIGQLAVDAEPVEVELTMHNPAIWIESVYTHLLRDRGVKVAGIPHDPDNWETRDFQWESPHTLAEALRHFLKVSENAVGEMVLLKLAETHGVTDEIDWPAGAKVISDWLVSTAGLEEGSFRLVDGSGLSRYNLISADSSVRLLAFMKTHEHFHPFFDGLPVYKVALPEGEKWGGVPVAEFEPERVFAKPGGMSGVSTISGYVKTLDGRWLAFSFLANGYIGSNKPVIELRNAVWSELVRYRAAGVEAEKPMTP
jgi:D-alanyl-D-alanine carboxypeptidase/D-alanyl-D-alanine-endopeptidase (penicillin-binding protein 4)